VFSGTDNPGASDSSGSALTDQIEIDDIALAVRVRLAEFSLGFSGCSKDGCLEFFSIGSLDSH
jgi:hypothetical protein